MRFLWHHALWVLLVLPVLIGSYFLALRRKRQQALLLTRLALTGQSASPAVLSRAHVSALLMLLGITALLLSISRPAVVTTSPARQGTVVLLIDVSLSMAATDVPPTRLDAARAAALEFVRTQPADVRIGIVAFGGHADVVLQPTANRNDIIAALHRLELQRFTAIGNGLMGAILTIMPTADIPQGYDIFGSGAVPASYEARSEFRQTSPPKVAPGSYLSAAIILVSDGLGTMGVPAAKAAQIAADLGIRVYTVGVGTLYGGVANIEGWPPIHAEFSEQTLQEVADITRGEYFLARNAEKVSRIYEKLGRRIVLERTEHEITVFVAALGMLLSIAAAGLSLVWSARPG
jgi:Ca-activated chloride channel family protein